MSNGRRLIGSGVAGVAICLPLSACAPVMQDARLLAPGAVAVTPAISGNSVSDRGSEYLGETFGARVEVGVHDRVNVSGGIGRFDVSNADEGINGAGFGARIGLVKDRVAFSVPFSVAFGEHVDKPSDTWTFHPTALFTVPAGARLDINPWFRVVVPLCPECDASDILLGFGSGVGILVHRKVTLRPEFGLLVNPGESGVIWTFGAGLTLRSR